MDANETISKLKLIHCEPTQTQIFLVQSMILLFINNQISLQLLKDTALFGSESEYKSVRLATADSVTEIAIHEESVRDYAFKFLFDLFNDEHHTVRQAAVNNVARLNQIQKLVTSPAYFTVIQLVLRDSDPNARKGAYELVEELQFESEETFIQLVHTITSNISKYKEHDLVYSCLSKMPVNNIQHMESAINTFLQLKPPYLPVQFSIDDPRHISHLIIIYNAVALEPNLLRKIPKYVTSKYHYAKATLHPFIPEIESLSISLPIQSGNEIAQDVLSDILECAKEGNLALVSRKGYTNQLLRNFSNSPLLVYVTSLLIVYREIQQVRLIDKLKLLSKGPLAHKSMEHVNIYKILKDQLEKWNSIQGLPKAMDKKLRFPLEKYLSTLTHECLKKYDNLIIDELKNMNFKLILKFKPN